MKKSKDYNQQIFGEYLRPCFRTEAEFEKGYKQSIFWTDKEFYSEYQKHLAALRHISECAKIYIFKNWKKIKNWSELDVVIVDRHSGEITEYFNNNKKVEKNKNRGGKKSETLSKMLERIAKDDKKRHNPVTTFDKVILDPIDGDFTVTINKKEHWWIQDEAVIIIADYIEKQLK